ncbi:MAG TPA: hypothetical protein VK907_03760 [Phnomibacter sp.]|nr:hypothetical protein [Phnomibacter sp.]
MELGSTITGAILLVLCIAPFVIIYYKSKQKEKNSLQALKTYARQHDGTIGHHEFCGNFLLGMDHTGKFVYFSRQDNGERIFQHIGLSAISTCQAVKKKRSVDGRKDGMEIIERVELCFIPLKKENSTQRFELYTEAMNRQADGEWQLVDRWVHLINERLAHRN